MVTTDIIQGEPFYNMQGVLFQWYGNRQKFRKSTYADLSAHGQFPYIEPDLESGTKKKTGEMVFIATFWTHFAVAKTEQELLLEEAENIKGQTLQQLADSDIGMIRGIEDHINATGKRATLPQGLQDKITRREGLRQLLAEQEGIMADGEIDETEKSWLVTQFTTFPTLKALFP